MPSPASSATRSWPARRPRSDGRDLTGIPRAPPRRSRGGAPGARPVPDARLPGSLRGPDAPSAARRVDVRDPRGPRRAELLDVGAVPGAAARAHHRRHPLRDEVVEVRHDLDRRLDRHAPRRRRDERRVRPRVLRRRLHHEPPARGRPRRQGLGRVRVRRRAARARAWRPGASARPAPVLLEEREVAARARAAPGRHARVLGGLRLPQLRRPMARAAVRRRLTWQAARVVDVATDNARTKTLVLELSTGHGSLQASTWTCGSLPRTATRHSAATRSHPARTTNTSLSRLNGSTTARSRRT